MIVFNSNFNISILKTLQITNTLLQSYLVLKGNSVFTKQGQFKACISIEVFKKFLDIAK